MSRTVAITALSGFASFTTALHFLRRGWHVRGSVRSPEKGDKLLSHPLLQEYVAQGKVSTVVVPGLASGDFGELLKGVDALAHTASPFGGPKTWEEFRDRALALTLTVLKQAAHVPSESHSRQGCIKSVAVMSSLPTTHDLRHADPDRIYTDKDWNTHTETECIGVAPGDMMGQVKWWWVAKKIVEKAVWETYAELKPAWSLAVILPSVLFGPLYHAGTAADLPNVQMPQSFLLSLIKGKDAPLMPTFAPNYTDVRTCAQAFYEAVQRGARGRFLLNSGLYTFQQMADIARQVRPDLLERIPVGTPGNDETMTPAVKVDISKGERELGLEYFPLDKTVKDILDYFEQIGALSM